MRVLKAFFVGFFLIGKLFVANAQSDTAPNKPETTRVQKKTVTAITPATVVKKDSAQVTAQQNRDSILLADSTRLARVFADSIRNDSLRKAAQAQNRLPVMDTSTYRRYETHPYLPMQKPAVYMLIDYHTQGNKDELFYLMMGVLLLLAFIRMVFSKYFRNMFLLFFQTSLRQKQTRDQLLQNNLASLLTNFLFLVSAGLYITLVIQYYHWTDLGFWMIAAGSASVLLLVYLAKYLFLLFTGWVFNTKEAAGSYVFVVFLVNKIIGVLLVPFLLILAFAATPLVNISLTVSIGLVGLLFIYRYWVSFAAVRSRLKVNPMHFFLYLCAVELLPLALIYKVLINYFNGTA